MAASLAPWEFIGASLPKVEWIFPTWHFYLVGGLEHVCFYPFFPHSVGTFIVPTDFNSIIFQRGRAQPPTSYGLWYIVCPGKKAGTRVPRAWDFVMAGMHPCIAFVLNDMFTPNVQRGWRLVQWGQLIYLSFFEIFAAYFVNSKIELDQPETPETMKASDSVTGCIRFLHCKTSWGFVQPLWYNPTLDSTVVYTSLESHLLQNRLISDFRFDLRRRFLRSRGVVFGSSLLVRRACFEV